MAVTQPLLSHLPEQVFSMLLDVSLQALVVMGWLRGYLGV